MNYEKDSDCIKVCKLLRLNDQTIYKRYHAIKPTAFDIN